MENGDRAIVTISAKDPDVQASLKAILEAAGYRTAEGPASSEAVLTVGENEAVIPLEELEQRAIEHALRVTGGRVAKAARLLGIGRATLYRRLAARPIPAGAPTTSTRPPAPHASPIH